MQVRAAAGSAGQGSERACHNIAPLAASSTPAMPNTQPLCSDNQTSCGNAETSPTSAAPAPSDTITAGSTQHTSVAELASSEPKATPTLRCSGSIISLRLSSARMSSSDRSVRVIP